MSGNISNLRADFSEVVRSIVDTMLLDLMVCMPGKIVKYDKDTQYADVQIQLMQGYLDGSTKPYAVVPNVPVKHPRANGGKAFIHMPLKPGDDVTLHFSSRSIDNWKTQGGMSDPNDSRKHHITDAFASIGGSALPDAFSPTTDDSIEIVNETATTVMHPDGTQEITAGDSQIVLHPDGTYNLFGGNGDDFIQVVNDLILGIQRAYTLTLLGNQPLFDPLDPEWIIILQRAAAFKNGSDPYGGI